MAESEWNYTLGDMDSLDALRGGFYGSGIYFTITEGVK